MFFSRNLPNTNNTKYFDECKEGLPHEPPDRTPLFVAGVPLEAYAARSRMVSASSSESAYES